MSYRGATTKNFYFEVIKRFSKLLLENSKWKIFFKSHNAGCTL
jgi:hypothetical protein